VAKSYSAGESPPPEPVRGLREVKEPAGDVHLSDQTAPSDQKGDAPSEAESLKELLRKSLQELLAREKSAASQTTRRSKQWTQRQRKSGGQELGYFTFSTYQWDYAPYMRYLKKHIQQHIFPPEAFTRLAQISGYTRLRFKILPDGRITALKVLEYGGHRSLMETSIRAITLSAPFKPLPRDFPENYLEVTCSFWYVIDEEANP